MIHIWIDKSSKAKQAIWNKQEISRDLGFINSKLTHSLAFYLKIYDALATLQDSYLTLPFILLSQFYQDCRHLNSLEWAYQGWISITTRWPKVLSKQMYFKMKLLKVCKMDTFSVDSWFQRKRNQLKEAKYFSMQEVVKLNHKTGRQYVNLRHQ